MASFFVGEEFPSFKPIKTTAAKALELVNARLASETDAAKISALNVFKVRLTTLAADKAVYLTIENAILLGIISK